MLEIESNKVVGTYRMTPFPYLGHQGTHLVDCVVPISLDLKKKCFLDNNTNKEVKHIFNLT